MEENPSIDAAVVDYYMPEMDGLELAKQIRALKSPFVQPRIIAMKEDQNMCLKARMNDFLTKPIRLDDIKGAIERSAS